MDHLITMKDDLVEKIEGLRFMQEMENEKNYRKKNKLKKADVVKPEDLKPKIN
jgi:hypothetical protein